MAPAIRLAQDGFPVGKILADFIATVMDSYVVRSTKRG